MYIEERDLKCSNYHKWAHNERGLKNERINKVASTKRGGRPPLSDRQYEVRGGRVRGRRGRRRGGKGKNDIAEAGGRVDRGAGRVGRGVGRPGPESGSSSQRDGCGGNYERGAGFVATASISQSVKLPPSSTASRKSNFF